ncbi:hypothetical protein SNE40_003834 [Patella caerulea]|uniref:Fibrinogen C-terminal domain-containing protein n=1 Tax=Patella caerulea TaxID=87958 RepID=A0AAN8KHI9_PATCE
MIHLVYFATVAVYPLSVSGLLDTWFLEEPILSDTCDQRTELYEGVSYWKLGCGQKCLEMTNCRRMLICQEPNEYHCMFYYDGDYCVYEGDDTRCNCYRKLKACTDGRNCTCPLGYYGDTCDQIITECSDGFLRGMAPHGYKVASIKPTTELAPYDVVCHFEYGGYTTIMSRENTCCEQDFNRNWTDYVEGFGNVHGVYWLGLKKIYNLLMNHPVNILKVDTYYNLNKTNQQCSSFYENMALGDASADYGFHVDKLVSWSKTVCGDSLLSAPSINDRPFSTYDHDFTSHNCPVRLAGGWWYADDPDCSEANINGRNNELKWVSTLTGTLTKIQMSLQFL